MFRREAEYTEVADQHHWKYAWFGEHHCLTEYSHMSAPEVVMGLVAGQTDYIHLSTGITSLSPRKEHPVRRRVIFVTLLLVLVLIAGALGVWGLWRSHFVGAESNGHVAVYQGVPWNIAGNLHLYRTVYESPLLVEQLSPGGRLVVPVGTQRDQWLEIVRSPRPARRRTHAA